MRNQFKIVVIIRICLASKGKGSFKVHDRTSPFFLPVPCHPELFSAGSQSPTSSAEGNNARGSTLSVTADFLLWCTIVPNDFMGLCSTLIATWDNYFKRSTAQLRGLLVNNGPSASPEETHTNPGGPAVPKSYCHSPSFQMAAMRQWVQCTEDHLKSLSASLPL